MEVEVKGLPPKSVVVIDWANNTVRGYEVGSFATDTSGVVHPLVVEPDSSWGNSRLQDRSHDNGNRCADSRHPLAVRSTSSSIRARWSLNPQVTVTPGTGLTDGQDVHVSVSGFGESGKVFLSECDHAEDANCPWLRPATCRAAVHHHRHRSLGFGHVRRPWNSSLEAVRHGFCRTMHGAVRDRGNAR